VRSATLRAADGESIGNTCRLRLAFFLVLFPSGPQLMWPRPWPGEQLGSTRWWARKRPFAKTTRPKPSPQSATQQGASSVGHHQNNQKREDPPRQQTSEQRKRAKKRAKTAGSGATRATDDTATRCSLQMEKGWKKSNTRSCRPGRGHAATSGDLGTFLGQRGPCLRPGPGHHSDKES
jgi:hypothetical protein